MTMFPGAGKATLVAAIGKLLFASTRRQRAGSTEPVVVEFGSGQGLSQSWWRSSQLPWR